MGTRCTIKIEGACAKVYKHWDGYPEANLEWLNAFISDFSEHRGDDPDYCLAQLLRFTGDADNAISYDLDKSKFTGWGIIPNNANMGQEYEYTLNAAKGTVTIEEVEL